MSAHRFDFYLGAASGLRTLVQETKKIASIQQAWEKSAPPALLPACHVGPLHEGTLTVFANNGAVAAKLRQQTGKLAEKLRKWGVEVTSIHIEVQAGQIKPTPQHIKDIAIGATGLAELQDLAENLAESPLKSALQRLVQRHSRS